MKITNEKKSLLKKLYDGYDSQMIFLEDLEDFDKNPSHALEVITDNLILCCRMNSILEVLDILEIDYEIEDGKIIFDS